MTSKQVRSTCRALIYSCMAFSLIGCQLKPDNLVSSSGAPGRFGHHNNVFGGNVLGGDMPTPITKSDTGSGLSAPSTGNLSASVSTDNTAVDPKKELIITDLSVVEDPIRTQNMGPWTFGYLMTQMAHGQDPSDFVLNWLKTWETDLTVNGDVVKARKIGIDRVIELWPKLPNGKLDLSKSPFRLTAITNRIDLRKESDPTEGCGEGRLVFSWLDPSSRNVIRGAFPDATADDDRTLFNVIFEYGVDYHMVQGNWNQDFTGDDLAHQAARLAAVEQWGERWHILSKLPYGRTYNAMLQGITDVFTRANANPAKPNGSALHQLRSNEVQLAIMDVALPGGNRSVPPVWELREFHVMPSGFLGNVPMALTPRMSLNNTTTLGDYINANEAQILQDAHTMPLDMEAGSALVPGAGGDPELVWDAPNIFHKDDARFKFAQNTCNGCHLRETGLDRPKIPVRFPGAPPGLTVPQAGIGFMQVRPRLAGHEAVLSDFMAGRDSNTGAITGDVVTDPVTGKVRSLNDTQRRVDDFKNVLSFSSIRDLVITNQMLNPFPTRTD